MCYSGRSSIILWKSRFKFTFLFLSIACFSFAQNQDAHWFFGNGAALKFGGIKPVSIANDNLYTSEGSASISDENGNLLLYTDGITLWNKKHTIVPKGRDLKGHKSSTQSALILKQPGQTNLFFLFTITERANNDGLSYSIIDISRNKGEGEVITKNKIITVGVSEKLMAVTHANGCDIWIICHEFNSNVFKSYLLSANGIEDAQQSACGLSYNDNNGSNSIGYLVANGKGNLIATVSTYSPVQVVQLFNFDNSTGKLTFNKEIKTERFPYGVCFSPDDSKLYVSFEKGDIGVAQYDLLSNSSSIIKRNLNLNSYGALRGGPDGKIYIAKSGKYLDAILKPNSAGELCNYTSNYIYLDNGSCAFGLPNSIVTPACNKEVEKTETPCSDIYLKAMEDTVTCDFVYKITVKSNATNLVWSTKEKGNSIIVSESGYYKVTASTGNCSISDSVKIDFLRTKTKFKCLKEFSPKNTLFNKVFEYSINYVTEFELKVYDKKKNLVFTTTNSKEKWNGFYKGKMCPEGDYKYEVKYRTVCNGNKWEEVTGVIAIKD